MKCTSTYHRYSLGGDLTVCRCVLETPHDREPPYGFAMKGSHRDDDGHFWDDASSHEAVVARLVAAGGEDKQ